ncbi:MAG TPA: tRNA (adenosine(37)-N6)-threonylcarbamoyltransferase complex dimerization subunit type 1 TsaB [Candidatus Baltobacteraceae bacterium]|jgi:tRNA threonylcarbamoyladenosine biosynthesis protein TsaB|nr:tRNA (adenosine(37)-N6)-threonylcarbamoyltransferase complex dimerization subunit type 1 TsaB [Candidatus Baltobacteraceae bacterium]
MNVLAVDGALGGFSAALVSDGRVAGQRCESGNVALERGLSTVSGVLLDAGRAPAEIDRLAVGVGPGTFTGLRVAIAYAKALAAVWGRPLVPIDSFDILEFGRTFEDVLTVVVGRPGVISARYRFAGQMRRASGRTADVLGQLVLSRTAPLDVVGAPEDVLHALAERAIIVRPIEPLVSPAAAAAALAALSREPARSPHQVRADYGELPAVTIAKKR